MKNTKPLKEFLRNAMDESEFKNYQKAANLQGEWLKKYGNGHGAYKVMYR